MTIYCLIVQKKVLKSKFSFMEENRNIEMRAETPSFVYRDGMTANIEYVEWLSEVKARFRRSQIKASVRVNTSMLEFYWSVGRDLVAKCLRPEKATKLVAN